VVDAMQALDARAKELEAAQEECRVLQGHVDAREAADRKTAEAAAEAKRVAAQAAAESVARAAAEQEMQEMANQLKNMAIQVVSLESKEHQEEEAQAAVVAALSDELTSATRESRALTNRLEEHLKDLEQTIAAL
jgi:seryl-tRNA synthetase